MFSGISTFGRIEYSPCLKDTKVNYDIAFIGAPFDTGVSGNQAIGGEEALTIRFRLRTVLVHASDRLVFEQVADV